MNSTKQIKYGAVISYLAFFINILAGILYTPWMIETIGREHYGLYTLANSLISLFLVDFGLSAVVSTFLSKYRAEGEEEKSSKLMGVVYKLYLMIDAIIAIAFIVLFFFIDELYVNLTTQEIESFKIVFCIAACFSIINFPAVTFNGILTAYEKFIELKLADLFYRIGVVLFTIIALINGMGLYALVSVNAICGILIIVYKFLVIKSKVKLKVDFKGFDKYIFSLILGFSFWTTVASLSQRLIFNITPTVIGMRVFEASAAIAVFGIVTTLEGYTYSFTTAINGMFLPRISKILAGDNQRENLNNLNVRVGGFQFVLNSLIFIGFLCIGKEFIVLWVGKDFVLAYYCLLMILLPGIFFNSMQTINTTLMAKNLVNLQAIVNVIMGVVNVILSYILSKKYGVIGASFSIFVAYMLRCLLLLIAVKSRTDVDVWGFIKGCYLKMILPTIVALIESVMIVNLIHKTGWIFLVIKALIIVSIYFVNLIVYEFIIKGIKKKMRKIE